MPRRSLGTLIVAALVVAACEAPDPKTELALSDVETYWAVDRSVGETQYIAPVVRFRLTNTGAEPRRSIQATATFRRTGEEQAWSSGFWQQRGPEGTHPLAPGESAVVVLKPEGEGRYTSTGPPDGMFRHGLFKDVRAEVFLKVGSSSWVKFRDVDVERRIGSRSVQELAP